MFRDQRTIGQPLYNLETKLLLYKTNFEGSSDKVMDDIKNYGRAISFAQKYLEGLKYVTEGGYIFHEAKAGLDTKQATLQIDSNVSGLIILDKLINGELKGIDKEFMPNVHIHFGNKSLDYIKTDRVYLFLYELNEQWKEKNNPEGKNAKGENNNTEKKGETGKLYTQYMQKHLGELGLTEHTD